MENVECEVKSGDKHHSDDISLEFEYMGFVAPPAFTQRQKLEDLPLFLREHGTRVTKLSYTDQGGENYRQLILKYCPNISELKLEFTEYPDEVDDDKSQMLVKWLAALAPGLTRLETVNNVIGLHYLSCMGYIYENFSNKIKFVKTDELKPEELSVLSGYNNKDNPALSLEELIFCDNDFLCSRRVQQSPESLALKPAALTDLVKLKNLTRIDLPFFLNKDKIPRVTTLPLLTQASIRLLSNKRGKVSISPFIENIGIAVANVTELKLCNKDPGLMVLHSILKNCKQLELLDLTDLYINDECNMGIAALAGATLKFKHLSATIHSTYSHEIDLILYLIENVTSLITINIDGICNEEFIDKLTAASIILAEKVQQDVELNLKWSYSAGKKENTKVPKELPSSKPDNLKISVKFSD